MKKLVTKNLDDLFKHAKKISKEWGCPDAILISILKECVEKSKMKSEDPQFAVFQNAFNNVLDKLYITCEDKSKEIGTKSVSHKFLRDATNFIKDKYNEGNKKQHL